MSESQVVHYMLCCHTGICAPTDLVLPALASNSLIAAGLRLNLLCHCVKSRLSVLKWGEINNHVSFFNKVWGSYTATNFTGRDVDLSVYVY